MPKIEVDLLPPQEPGSDMLLPRRRLSWKKIIASLIIIAIIVLAVFSSSVVFSDESLIKNLSKLNFIQQFGRLITSRDRELYGESQDRINILIIGMGGKNHEGGTLADTIILGSFKPSTKQVAMMSIPRDLTVPWKNYGWIRINAVNAYAEKEQAGSGGPAMIELLDKMLNIDIHYYVTIDFDGFEKVIDEFGGVDINVDKDLIDYQYPVRGREDAYPIESRFEILKIKKGQQHMNGELALKYARSRHALGAEGSDFARSQRQQKVIVALKEKIFSAGTFFSPKKINSLLSAYNENIKTNLEIWELLRLSQLGQNTDTSQIISKSITDGADSLLYSKMINGAYVLLPKKGNFSELASAWQNIFGDSGGAQNQTSGLNVPAELLKAEEQKASSSETKTSSTPAETKPETEQTDQTIGEQAANEELPFTEEKPKTLPQPEGATVEIQNGTFITGWAAREKTALENEDLKVVKTGNASLRNYNSIIIYDFSGDKNPTTAEILRKKYGVAITSKIPSGLNSVADFLIILGKK
ncbi:MAG: LCP family protein [Patescibacteria group bacterium]